MSQAYKNVVISYGAGIWYFTLNNVEYECKSLQQAQDIIDIYK